jgi:hypothetical protein
VSELRSEEHLSKVFIRKSLECTCFGVASSCSSIQSASEQSADLLGICFCHQQQLRSALLIRKSVLLTRTLKDGLRLAEHADLSAAVLDFGLSDGEAGELCQRLNGRGVPYVLYSGYGHVGEACRGGLIVPKPARPGTLIDALSKALTRGGERCQAL